MRQSRRVRAAAVKHTCLVTTAICDICWESRLEIILLTYLLTYILSRFDIWPFNCQSWSLCCNCEIVWMTAVPALATWTPPNYNNWPIFWWPFLVVVSPRGGGSFRRLWMTACYCSPIARSNFLTPNHNNWPWDLSFIAVNELKDTGRENQREICNFVDLSRLQIEHTLVVYEIILMN